MLVPLETLDGRNQYDFAAGEEPPWRWRVPLGLSRRSAADGRGYQSASWCSITPSPVASSRPPGKLPVKVPNGCR